MIHYQLQQQYSGYFAQYTVLSNAANVTTGNISRVVEARVSRGILLPVNVARKYALGTTSKVGPDTLLMGAVYDMSDRILITPTPLAMDFSSFIVTEDNVFNIEKIGREPVGNLYYLRTQANKKPFGNAVQNLQQFGFTAQLPALAALDIYSNQNSIANTNQGLHWLPCGVRVTDALYPVVGSATVDGTFTTYKELGLNATLSGQIDIDYAHELAEADFVLSFLQSGTEFVATLGDLCITATGIYCGDYIKACDMTGWIDIYRTGDSLSIKRNDVAVVTIDLSLVTLGDPLLAQEFTFTKVVGFRHFVLAPHFTRTSLIQYHRSLGHNVN